MGSADDAVAGQGAPPARDGRCVAIGGLAVLVRSSPSTAWTVDELLAPAEGHPGPARLTLDVSDEPATVPDGEPVESYGSIRIWRDGDRLVVDSGQGVVADADSCAITVRGAVSPSQFARGLRRCLHYAMAHLLTVNGRAVVHAAAVARDAHGLLLLGGTGAGKSTTAYLAASGGWTVVADDQVALWIDDGDVWATGVPRSLNVPADVLHAGEAADTRDALSHDARDRRRLLTPLDHRPVRIAAVALVRHGTGEGAVFPATQTDMFGFLFVSAPDAGHPPSAGRMFAVTAAVLRHTLWHLETGETVAQRKAALPGLLDTMLPRES
ncbi:MAG: hypothetical protein JWM93_366 [Frankiales bacterium]|nr:hypothetical protein [Frankiales bacterium]